MKWFLIFCLGIFMLSFSLAGTCTPSSGYSTCYEYENTYSGCNPGSITSEVTIQTSGYPKYDATTQSYYIDYKFEGDEFYVYKRSFSSWDDFNSISDCDEDGCYSYTQTLSSQGRYIVAQGIGNSYNGNLVFAAQDRDTTSSGCWSWVSAGYGWVGSSKIDVNIACEGDDQNWVCSDWSECSNNQQTRTCTTVCGLAVNKPDESRSCNECADGETKCEGNNFFRCSKQGACPEGQYCIALDTSDDPAVWQEIGPTQGQCGVECVSNGDCSSLTSQGNNFCVGNDIYRTDSSGICSNYQCGTTDSDVLIESCDYGCSEAKCKEQTTITVYNLLNNSCVSQQIFEDEITDIDYRTKWACEQKQDGEVYRLVENGCIKTLVLKEDIGLNDYETLEECESKITYAEPLTNWQKFIIFINSFLNKIKGIFN